MNLRQAGAHAVAQGFAVDHFAFQCGFRGFDDCAHLFHGVGAGFGEGFGDSGIHFGVAGAGGEIEFKDGEFFGFLVDEILTVAFSELVDGFFALLNEGLQDLDGFRFIERVDFLGFFVLDGGFYSAKDTQAELVFGAHSVDEVFLDFFGDGHGSNIAEEKETGRIYTQDTDTQSSQKRSGTVIDRARGGPLPLMF
jgi:hypothetical protein